MSTIPIVVATVQSEPIDNSIPIANIYSPEPESPDDWVRMDIGYGWDSRREIHDMYKTIIRLDLVDWIKNYSGRYSDCEEYNKISKGLENNNHSGFSFSSCLHLVSQVFKEGWYPKYCNPIIAVQH